MNWYKKAFSLQVANEILNTAPGNDITQKYRNLVKKYHPDPSFRPDKSPGDENKFYDVALAYQIVKNNQPNNDKLKGNWPGISQNEPQMPDWAAGMADAVNNPYSKTNHPALSNIKILHAQLNEIENQLNAIYKGVAKLSTEEKAHAIYDAIIPVISTVYSAYSHFVSSLDEELRKTSGNFRRFNVKMENIIKLLNEIKETKNLQYEIVKMKIESAKDELNRLYYEVRHERNPFDKM